MNLKIALAAALMISGGTFVAQAQQKPATAKTSATSSSAAKAFEKKILSFKNETDAKSAAAYFESLTSDMISGIAATKSGLVAATNDAEKTKLTEQMNARVSASNTAIRLFDTNPNNKTAIVQALNEYAKTL